jgi:hypothetical protein
MGKTGISGKKRDSRNMDGKTPNFFHSYSRNIPSRYRFSRKYENGTGKNGIWYRTKRDFSCPFSSLGDSPDLFDRHRVRPTPFISSEP